MADDLDKVDKIHDTVHGMQLDFVSMKKDQEATNKSVKDICGKLDRYAEGSENRITTLEADLGSRIPDDPNVFSQVQTLQSRTKRHDNFIKSTWGFISALVFLVVSQIFGWFGKGH